MTAPTAASILRQLDAHRLGVQMAALAALDDLHRDEVRRALSAVRGTARIDLPVLIETIRRDVAERARQAQAAGDPFQYWITIATREQLAVCRDALKRGASIEDAMAEARHVAFRPAHDVARRLTKQPVREEPDEEVDEDPSPRRRRLRGRSRERARARPEAPAPARAGQDSSGPQPEPRQSFFGPKVLGPGDPARPLGAPVGLGDYEAWRRPGKPPWLVGGDDEQATAA